MMFTFTTIEETNAVNDLTKEYNKTSRVASRMVLDLLIANRNGDVPLEFDLNDIFKAVDTINEIFLAVDGLEDREELKRYKKLNPDEVPF